MGHQSPSNIYQQVEINSSNHLQLVVMLYDGAIRFISLARTAILNRDMIGKVQNLDRALAIIAELQNTLKIDEGGEIAAQLDRLYTYMNERMLAASAKIDPEPLTEVIKLLKILNAAWSEVVRKKAEIPLEAAKSASTLAQPTPAVQGNRLTMEVYG
jgi:flagellar secretion chaperone FliS